MVTLREIKEKSPDRIVQFPNSTAVFVKGVTHREARELEGRTLHPAAMHKLFLEQTDVVRPLFREYGAYFAVVFASEKPMETYIKDGKLSVTATYDNETMELTSSVDNLIKAGIDKKAFEKGGKALYIFDGYNVDDDSKPNCVSFAVVDAYPVSAAIRGWLKGNSWRQEKGGLASTKRVDSPRLQDVFIYEYVSKEGIILGSGYCGGWRGGGQGLRVGGWSHLPSGVFKESAGTSLGEDSKAAKPTEPAPAEIIKLTDAAKELVLQKISALKTDFAQRLAELELIAKNL